MKAWLGALAGPLVVSPDQDRMVAFGDPVPIPFSHDPRAKRRTDAIELPKGKACGQLVYRADIEVTGGVETEFEMGRNT